MKAAAIGDLVIGVLENKAVTTISYRAKVSCQTKAPNKPIAHFTSPLKRLADGWLIVLTHLHTGDRQDQY
ncbi:hypothetical protein CesoFtcFv8_016439 [Champsocephalus esox]|uniref:Uncharacterized protein n=2 Tax=Champsocephalus TaxID=52236 RepID=A0AAN8HJS9_CHAGU|nr:hypothetical protein CesoFtcFv8_016439 [Champsocephalus esox]KAK5918336.1 hypothetical protein CgunFtcFv8_003109 [Champsocephalus gunnari]